MKSKDLALTAILLAIGAVLYAFIPNTGILTPDMVVTFATLAILLVAPKPTVGLGIGVVAGILGMFFSKSPIAWFNIPTHALGAYACALIVNLPKEFKTGKLTWKPALGAIAYGVVSGGLFITLMLILGMFPFQVYLTAGWLQIVAVTFSIVVICMVLYPPAKTLYDRNS